jgi:hypothetical protein
MDFIKSEIKNIVIFVAILGGLYLAYQYFFPAEAPLTTTSYPEGSGGDVGGDVLSFLTELKKIRLDQGVFNDPVFEALTDFSTELGHEDAGRDNPFAPLKSSASVNTNVNIRTSITR